MFQHILAPLDGSTTAECTLPHLAALAKVYESRITILRVLECPTGHAQKGFVDPLDWALCKAEAEAYLKEDVSRLWDEANVKADFVLREGQPAERIVEFARDHDIDLILLSSHGRTGLSVWNVSSVVHKIIQKAHLSTMIVRAYKPPLPDIAGLRYERVLVPLDGSWRAECVFPTATALARFYDADLLVGHVVPQPEMPHRTPAPNEDRDLIERFIERNRRYADEYLDHLQTQLSVTIEPHLLISTDTALSLHELVEQEHVDLVILSAHGYSARSRWPYGSITTSFIEYGETSLLIVQDMVPEEMELSQADTVVMEIQGH